jgi:hypothetical protein
MTHLGPTGRLGRYTATAVRRVIRGRTVDRRELPHVATPQRSLNSHRNEHRPGISTPWSYPIPSEAHFSTTGEAHPRISSSHPRIRRI